jgi:aspartyl-tRNA(Asn)/glutamyl-tRNA(Gln) amidotransferase subunit A
MNTDSLNHLSIIGLAPLIQSREVSPVEVVDAALAQAERLQPVLNSFITLLADDARRDAKEREKAIKAGEYRGPLDGIPIGIKDNIATKGIRTTVGSKVLRDYVPQNDAAAVSACKQAGAIIIGKENLHEFAAGGTSENPHYGAVHNPWDVERIPGGSSGGGAANVAARVTHASLGTDLAGSVRIPASYCGLVGLKPTYGRVSQRGIQVTSHNGDHIGPMTRSVADCAVMLQVLAGNDPADPSTVPVDVPDYTSRLGQPIANIRIGVPTNYYFDLVDAEVDAAVRKAIASMGELGAHVSDVEFSTLKYMELVRAGTGADSFIAHEQMLKDHRDDYSPELASRMLASQFSLGRDYAKALKVQRLIEDEFAQVLQDVDIIATPTMAFSPRRIGTETAMISGKEHPLRVSGAGDLYLGHNTHVSNATGLPTITVPCGLTSEGLPVGLQLIGRPFEEALLLQAAAQYEKISGWDNATPELAN